MSTATQSVTRSERARARARAGIIAIAAAMAAGALAGVAGPALGTTATVVLSAVPQILTVAGVIAWWWWFAGHPRGRVAVVGLVASSLLLNLALLDGTAALMEGGPLPAWQIVAAVAGTLAFAAGLIAFAHLAALEFHRVGDGVAASRWRLLRWVYAVQHGLLAAASLWLSRWVMTGDLPSGMSAGMVAGMLFAGVTALIVMVVMLVLEIRALMAAWRALRPGTLVATEGSGVTPPQ